MASKSAAVLRPALGCTDSQSREALGGARAAPPPIEAAGLTAGEPQEANLLPFIDEAGRHRVLVERNTTEADHSGEACVHELFEAQAARTPEVIAVVCEGQRLTYADLNARANRLAHHLRGLGVRPDDRVAICVERSLEMVVGLMAILKAGGAYVPLDPGYPAERLAFMLRDSRPTVILRHGAARAALAAAMGTLADRPPVVDVDVDAPWIHAPAVNFEASAVGLTQQHLAYVIYTSGSTGQPKGVMVEHRNVTRLFTATQSWFRFDDTDVWTLFHSFAFDFSVWEIWGALLHGGRLVVVPRSTTRSPQDFYALLREERVTVLNHTPSAFSQLIAALQESDDEHSLRYVIFGGEALNAGALKGWFRDRRNRHTRLINMYGITETTVHVTYCPLNFVDSETRAASRIGRPIPDLNVYILDDHCEPVAIGHPGEIYVGGAGVARGYLNRPELTAERFIASPFVEGDRLYRSGDLGHYRPDGTIEYLGRNDSQVKIRGFRIELGEIEARLAEHPRVWEAVALAREDAPGDRRIVAYYTTYPDGAAPSAETLRTHLAARLPEYMVPAAYVRLDALPLTANGKLDRRALPSPKSEAFAARGYRPPQGKTEEALAGIWGPLLRVDRVGRHDNFFELGGHSLLGVRMLSRLRQAFGVVLPLADLFAKPTLAEFSAAAETGARGALLPIELASRDDPPPLSFAQQRLWFLAQIDGVSEAYHIALNVRLKGELDKPALRRALDRLVARHEALRTTFVVVDGQAVQRIAPADLGFALEERDVAGERDPEGSLQRLVAEEGVGAFDLQRGPLARGRLIRLANSEHALLLTLHHIVSDGWSTGVLNRELGALYAAFSGGRTDPLPDLAIQYVDYAVWQRRWMSEAMRQEQADYWRRTLAGAPAVLNLPVDHIRLPKQDYAGSALPLEFGERVTAGLKALSLRRGTTLFMTLLAGWAVLLSRLSGQDDLVIGAAVANRGRVEIEPLIGFFVNSLALRLDLSGRPSVGELLDRVKKRVLDAQQHEDLSFEHVVEIVRPPRSRAHEPIFQTMFAWQNHEEEPLDLPGLRTTSLSTPRSHAKYDLTLSLGDAGGRIVGDLEYASALFDRDTIERHAGYLSRLFEAMAADETRKVDRLPLLGEAERHRVLVEWNATEADYPQHACVHELVEAQARRTPQAIAVAHNDDRLTYAELDAGANRLARHLRTLGVRPGDRVAIALDRSIGLVLAQLAILKCGGAYVPLDQTAPPQRQAFMIEDCDARVVLTGAEAVAPEMAGVTRLDIGRDIPAGPDARDWDPSVDGETGAYVIYTSGSSGEPKGVLAPHRAVVRLAVNNGYADFQPTDRVAFASSPAFDASTMEVWATLLNGGCVVVIDHATLIDPQRFRRRLEQDAISVLWLTAGVFHQYAHTLAGPLARLRILIAGGDVLDPRVAARVLERSPPQRLLNGYGPTETTTFAATHWIREVAALATSIPIGRPISNARIYILDRHREPVPIGAAGEIHIGGAGVALGYLNRPELTAERFIASPFVAGDRLYRTGDLGRFQPDGTIEFLGRNDFQVKIRGFRIELGEIEARLAEHPAVHEAVVLAREDVPGDKRLVAYIIARLEAAAPEAETLRAHLSVSLPEYMVPAAYVRLEALPLTANGKLDRKALPAPTGEAFAARGYEPPLGETEERLARIFADSLGLERVGRHDNFFDLGGHSLLGIRLMLEIGRAFGKTLPVGVLFSAPTVAGLARDLDRGVEAPELMSVVTIGTGQAGTAIFMIHLIERDLARRIARRHPVYGLSFGFAAADPVQDLRWPESIEAFAAHYIGQMRAVQPHGPYRLVGHSLGGLIAYEMACQLAEVGEKIEFLGLLDCEAPDPAQKPRRLPLARVALNLLRTPPKLLLRRLNKKIEAVTMVCRAKIGLSPLQSNIPLRLQAVRVKSYRPKGYPGRVHLFKAAVTERPIAREPSPPFETVWRTLASGSLVVESLPGAHMDIVKDPLAASTAEAIERALDDRLGRYRLGAEMLSS
jgi:amino acid adenylation domain-containing protein